MDLKKLFYPESVAVVGASPKMYGGKLPYYQVLKSSGFAGDLYPVNPAHEEIDGDKVYPSLDELPDGIDFAIVSVPARIVLETMEKAVGKGIKYVHFFTSGFSEIGNAELEESLVKIAREGGARIVGPNCIGVFCAESGVSFDPVVKQEEPGKAAFLGQSGGVTNDFVRMAYSRRIGINKAVSYGNQIDLRVEDYLEYFADDDAIEVIAAYIEDIKDGRRFVEVLKRITPRKPVIILKGGVTDEGAKAALSHTGAMAVRNDVWSAIMRQLKCIEAQTLEELLDILSICASGKMPPGPRTAFLVAGGGISVLFTDLAVQSGLKMPELDKQTQKLIAEKIPGVNTSTANPVDLGAFGIDFRIMAHAINAVNRDDNIDMIVSFSSLDFISMSPRDMVERWVRNFVDSIGDLKKPLAMVISRTTDNDPAMEALRIVIYSILRKAGIPVFDSIRDAVVAISSVLKWSAG